MTQKITITVPVQERILAQFSEAELIEHEIDELIKEMTFFPSQRDFLIWLMRTDRRRFENLVKATPKGSIPPPQDPDNNGVELKLTNYGGSGMTQVKRLALTKGGPRSNLRCRACQGSLDFTGGADGETACCPHCDSRLRLRVDNNGVRIVLVNQAIAMSRNSNDDVTLSALDIRLARELGNPLEDVLAAKRDRIH